MPASVTLELVIPPELGDADEVRCELRARVAAIERQVAVERARSGASVVGRRAILRQSWRGQPVSHEPRRGLRPRIAARSVWSRVEALLRNRAFVCAYRDAWTLWRTGIPVAFPIGTYWLRRFANVPIVASVGA